MRKHQKSGKASKKALSMRDPIPLKTTAAAAWQHLLDRSHSHKSSHGIVMQAFADLVEEHFKVQHRPGFYFARLAISRDLLWKICHEIIGASPTYCIRIRLMMEACAMLENLALNVSEIANELGFTSPAYFTNCFRSYMGCTPGQYRKLAENRYKT